MVADFRQQLLDLLPSVRAFSRALCGDAVRGDDLMQEALLKAWSNRHRFEPGTNLRAWLHTIVRNHFISEWRKHRMEVQDNDGMMAARLEVRPRQDDHMELADFKRQLMKLPEEQREALVLVGVCGFSYEEAADVCSCALGTIKSRVSRAREKLSALVSAEDEPRGGAAEAVADDRA